MTTRKLLIAGVSALGGALLLSALSAFQKASIGTDLLLARGYFVPVLVGGIAGGLCGLYLLRARELSRKLGKQHGELFAIFEGFEGEMYVADMRTHEVLYVNQHMRDLYGDLVGKRCWEVIQDGMAGPCPFCTNDRLLNGQGEPAEPVVWEHRNTKTGRWYECLDRAIRWPDGRLVRMEIAFDITDRKEAEARSEHLNTVLRAIRNVNQLIVKERDRGRLLQRACDLLVEERGYHNAWIILLDGTNKLVASFESGLGEAFRPMIEQIEHGKLTACGLEALGQTDLVAIEDPPATCRGCPLAKSYGGRGAMSLRLGYNERVYGLMCVSVPAHFTADEEEQSLFKEVAEDIAFALYGMELEDDRKRAEDEMRELARFPNENPSPVLRISDDGEVLYSNEASRALLSTWRCGPGPCLSTEPRQLVLDALKSGESRQAEVECGGQVLSLTFAPIVSSSYVNVYALDVTGRKRAEQALGESERKYRELVENANSIIVRTDADGNFTFFNEFAEEFFGYTSAEIIGRSAAGTIIPETDSEGNDLRSLIAEIIERPGDSSVNENENRRKDGARVRVVWTNRAIRDEDGKLTGLLSIGSDVTELRRAEAQTRLQREQLMQADKMVTLGTLVSGIGHEINNPNNFIMLNAPLLKGAWENAVPVLEQHYQEHPDFRLRGIPFPEARRMLPELFDDILHGAQRIKHIVGELKDYARSEETKLDEEVDLNKVVHSAATLLNAFIRKRTQKFSMECDEGIPKVRGSAQRIEQVTINLVQNACEALRSDQERVWVGTSYDAEREGVVLTVVDGGAGIPQEHLKQLTDPFFTTKRNIGGTGLGLSIAARIVQDHKGSLDFNSPPGEGTVVTVFLPVAVETEAGDTQ